MPDYGQEQELQGMPGSFGAAMRARPRIPLPSPETGAPSGLQSLMDFVRQAQAGYENQGPVAGITRSVMPSLATLIATTMPSIQMPASYKGFQQGYGTSPGFHMFNLNSPAGRHPKGSTVSLETLREHGVPYEPPPQGR